MPEQKAITSIIEFVEWTRSQSNQCLYRGLRKASWQVEAASFRRVQRNRKVEIDYLEDLLKKARNRRFDKGEGVKLHALEIFANLQHYGAATCLMDFTKDSLVALWFACQSQASHEGDENGKVVALSLLGTTRISEPTEEGAFLESPTLNSEQRVVDSILTTNKLWVWEALRLNERIASQKSVFVFGGKEIDEGIPAVLICKDVKQDILSDLSKTFGISSESLFPDLPGFAQLNAHDKPNPMSFFTYHDQGFNYWLGGRSQEAVDAYAKALNMNPSDEVAFLAYNNRGFIKAYSTVDLLGAIKDFSEAIRIDPLATGALVARGEVKLTLADFEGAIVDFEDAIRIEPDSAHMIVARGKAKKGLGDLDGALADFTLAVEKTQRTMSDFSAHRHRGNVKVALGDFNSALEDFGKAIEISPGDADAYYDRGLLRESLGHIEDAESDYARASEYGSDRVRNILQLGEARLGVGDLEAAIEEFNRAIKMDPRQAASYVSRGMAKLAADDLEGALADFNEAVWIDPSHGAAYSRRGIAKAQQSDLEGAMSDFDSALKINPRDAHAYYVRAIVKNDNGDLQGAINDIGTSISISPDSPEAYAFRGKLSLKLGQTGRACTDWRHALRLAERIGNTRVARHVSKYISDYCSS